MACLPQTMAQESQRRAVQWTKLRFELSIQLPDSAICKDLMNDETGQVGPDRRHSRTAKSAQEASFQKSQYQSFDGLMTFQLIEHDVS